MPDTPKQHELTLQLLDILQEMGFRYLLIDSYEPAFVSGNIELENFTLIPVRSLPSAEGECGMFASINDDIILAWASQTGPKVRVCVNISTGD